MEPVTFSCNNCGESHRKILPHTANITTCNKCGNLIDILPSMRDQNRNRRSENNSNNLRNRRSRIHYNNFVDDISNDSINDDFYDFNRYSGHDDYLPSVNDTNNNHDNIRAESELSSEINDFDMDSYNVFHDNNPLSRIVRQTNTRINPTPLLSHTNNINNNFRGNNRSLSMNARNNNLNNNNQQVTGMFSIHIPNDSYDRTSAMYHRSGFGYRGEDNLLHNFGNEFDDLELDLENEISRDLELMSRLNSNSISQRMGIIGSLIVQPQKPKIKLQKIKMIKE